MVPTQSRSLITKLQSPLLMVPAFPYCIPAVQDGAEHHHRGSKVEQSRGFNAEFHKNAASTCQHVLIFYTWEGFKRSDFPRRSTSLRQRATFFRDQKVSESSGKLLDPKGNVFPHCLPSTLGLTKHITPNPNLSLGLTEHITPDPEGFESIKPFAQRRTDL